MSAREESDKPLVQDMLREAFADIPKPDGWEDVLPACKLLNVAQCEEALHIVVRAQVEWEYYALPRLLIGALDYPSEEIVDDIIVALDVEMLKEDGRPGVSYEEARKIARSHFSKLTSAHRRAILSWLKFVEANSVCPWRQQSLDSAIAYWSK